MGREHADTRGPDFSFFLLDDLVSDVSEYRFSGVTTRPTPGTSLSFRRSARPNQRASVLSLAHRGDTSWAFRGRQIITMSGPVSCGRPRRSMQLSFASIGGKPDSGTGHPLFTGASPHHLSYPKCYVGVGLRLADHRQSSTDFPSTLFHHGRKDLRGRLKPERINER